MRNAWRGANLHITLTIIDNGPLRLILRFQYEEFYYQLYSEKEDGTYVNIEVMHDPFYQNYRCPRCGTTGNITCRIFNQHPIDMFQTLKKHPDVRLKILTNLKR